MKKIVFSGFFLMTTMLSKAFAGTGNASDGLPFILYLTGFLVLIIGLTEGIDYLKRNGKVVVHRILTFVKKRITALCTRKWLSFSITE
jgi:hypothetical protein